VKAVDLKSRTALHHAGTVAEIATVKWLVERGVSVLAVDANGLAVIDYVAKGASQPIAIQWLQEQGDAEAAMASLLAEEEDEAARAGRGGGDGAGAGSGKKKNKKKNKRRAKQAKEEKEEAEEGGSKEGSKEGVGKEGGGKEVGKEGGGKEGAKGGKGETDAALISAIGANDTSAMAAAVEAGASVMAVSGGITPLHYAAMRGKLGAMQWLEERGADVNAGDNAGKTVQSICSTLRLIVQSINSTVS
jgi:hypothetical protein